MLGIRAASDRRLGRGLSTSDSYRAAGVCIQGLRGVFSGLRQVARPMVGDPQGSAGVGVLRRDLQAWEQMLNAPVELAGGEVLESL